MAARNRVGAALMASDVNCPACGAPAADRYCTECGTRVRDATCASCGNALAAGARFCENCGTAAVAGLPTSAASRHTARAPRNVLAYGAILVVVAFVAGESASRWSERPAAQLATQSASVLPAGMPVAPDISTMTPQERANRLYDRVMSYSERGQPDSVSFFAQMAIQAYAMIGPLDAKARYELGAIFLAGGDAADARAQADTILAARPNHLLGLVLAIRAAALVGDSTAVASYRKRLVRAAATERRKGVEEYAAHAQDIDSALEAARPTR